MTKPCKTAILGAGIMGLSAAHALSTAGHIITLYDPAPALPPTQNASAIAGGMLAPYSEIEHMPHEWIAPALRGITFWKNFAQSRNIGFAQNGSLLLAHDEDAHILKRFETHLPQGAGTCTVPPAPLEKFSTGLLLKDEAHLNPQKTLAALRAGTSFTHIQKTAQPENLAAEYDFIIDCRGMGAAKTGSNLRGIKGEIIMLRNPDITLEQPVRLMHPRYPLYIVPQNDGIFLVGSTNIETDTDETPSVRSALELLSAAYSLTPGFGEAQILSIQAGIRPAYPDNLPRITISGNLISANGLFRHGYLLAPVMAECVKQYMEGTTHEFFNLFTRNENEDRNQRPGKNLRSAA